MREPWLNGNGYYSFEYQSVCLHTQCVEFKKPPTSNNLKITAASNDGLIEGMQVEDHVLTFQHHHENKVNDSRLSRATFKEFVTMVEAYHKTKNPSYEYTKPDNYKRHEPEQAVNLPRQEQLEQTVTVLPLMNNERCVIQSLRDDGLRLQDNTRRNRLFLTQWLWQEPRLVNTYWQAPVQTHQQKLNDLKADMISQFASHGLRREHLVNFTVKEDDCWHNGSFIVMMRMLLIDKHLIPEEAVREINNLFFYQASVLTDCYDHGLRGDHLRSWEQGEAAEFYMNHSTVLEWLIKEKHCEPSLAVKLLDRLNFRDVATLQERAMERWREMEFAIASDRSRVRCHRVMV